MKWIGLTVVLLAVWPASTWLRRHNSQAPKIWMLVGLLPFLMTFAHLVMAFTLVPDILSHYVHGLEFSVLDGLAVALYLSLPERRHSLPFLLPMSLYLIAVVLSAFQSQDPTTSLYYAWQLVRMFLLYVVVARGAADPRVAPAILTGMAVGLCLQLPVVLWQRFALHDVQASGTFDAQNILGLVSHFVIFPIFALFLARRRGWLLGMVVLAGITVEILTASRATIALAGSAYVALFLLSALRRWTSRKAGMALIGAAMVAVLVPVAFSIISDRTSAEIEGSDLERNSLVDVATAIISRYPLGVGANNYVIVANVEGLNAESGVAWTSNNAFVHNVYLLVTAETGFLGLVSFLFLLSRPLIVAFRCGWGNRGDQRGDLILGIGVALLTVYIHSLFEWIFVYYITQYIFIIDVGIVAGLAKQLGYWRRPSRRDVPDHVLGAAAYKSLRTRYHT